MESISLNSVKYIRGQTYPPGDKSISHRALILASVARGKSHLKRISRGRDCQATLRIMRKLGVKIEGKEGNFSIQGRGLRGLEEPTDILNCRNSGTTMRILSGLLAGQPFYSILSGDNSLRNRPMRRIVEPLSKMEARIFGRRQNEFPPLAILGGSLKGIDYVLPVASAQVKSCLLLAALLAEGKTSIKEINSSRDHTERMLRFMGCPVKTEGPRIEIRGGNILEGKDIFIPGDISAAAFFITGAVLLDGSFLRVKEVGLNPTRCGFLEVLKEMGADLKIKEKREICGEEVGNIEVRGGASLKGLTISGELIPRLIDEIPLLAVIGCFAQGETLIKDARELRVKETDRIRAISSELRKMGAQIEEKEDGMIIQGSGQLRGTTCRSWGDHRIAMALTIAALCAQGETRILNSGCISISFPGFLDTLQSLVSG